MRQDAPERAMQRGGAPYGNQHARKRGWTSRLHPVPLAEIEQAVDTALQEGDIATLRQAYNAYTFWRLRVRGQLLSRAITLLEADDLLRELDETPTAPDAIEGACSDGHR